MKACLVSHDYEEDLYNLKIDSPTCKCKATCLVMLKISVMK